MRLARWAGAPESTVPDRTLGAAGTAKVRADGCASVVAGNEADSNQGVDAKGIETEVAQVESALAVPMALIADMKVGAPDRCASSSPALVTVSGPSTFIGPLL